MASDGMLLNFSADDAFAAFQPKFKGGSWKDRHVAKKVARHRQQKRTTLRPVEADKGVQGQDKNFAAQGHPRGDFTSTRPSKRRRENGDFPSEFSQTDLPSRQDARDKPRTTHSSKPREVISSLFSYNPQPSAVVETTTEISSGTPAQPSNAPLIDGIDTFTSLGLSPTLATHLLTKMELKNPTAIQKSSVSQLVKEDSDAFIQSETGSGKTLAYLLPVVQRIMALSAPKGEASETITGSGTVHRNSGLFAIVLAPTRELCKQISVVLERLLGCAHWIVAGTVIGGEKKKSEKARLRKGLNILVATPGRLADHLENTRVLDISSVRWLILDEGDRLMDLGFEEEIQKIVKKLDERQKKISIPGMPERRTTVLCSATMKMNVQRLGEISLKDAVLIKPDTTDDEEDNGTETAQLGESSFSAPAQLKQSYSVVAAKLRLVTLTALLKRTFARKGSVMKAIVFVSCADSVDFHFEVFSRINENMSGENNEQSNATSTKASPIASGSTDQLPIRPSAVLSTSPNPHLTVYKLHGSLPQPTRTAIVKSFSATSTPSLLIATDVASRGLDLPNLDLVIEYDPAFSSDDHLHRIGRTARLGRDGRAVIFLLPGAEEGYVNVLKSSYRTPAEGSRGLNRTPANEMLKKGFAPNTTGVTSSNTGNSSSSSSSAQSGDWEQRATTFQLEAERWVLSSAKNTEMAKRAFQSHVRAYATHTASERKWFDIKDLHLGHLAKAFGLREKPGRMNVPGMGVGRGSGSSNSKSKGRRDGTNNSAREGGGGGGDGAGGGTHDGGDATEKRVTTEAEKKMREMVKKQKRKMMSAGGGADEFNIA